MNRYIIYIVAGGLLSAVILPGCKSSRIPGEPQKSLIESNTGGKGPVLIFEFTRGKEHNHPSFVLWAEDMDGNYLQTLFISKAVGSGVYVFRVRFKGLSDDPKISYKKLILNR